MALILDVNVLFRSVGGGEASQRVRDQFRRWASADENFHAPTLLPYEIASALTRAVVAGIIPEDRIPTVWAHLQAIPVTFHEMDDGARVIEIARELKRQSAYDAAYLALAERLNLTLYTFDEKLYNNASSLGFRIALLS